MYYILWINSIQHNAIHLWNKIYEKKMRVNKSNWINTGHISSFSVLKICMIFDKGVQYKQLKH